MRSSGKPESERSQSAEVPAKISFRPSGGASPARILGTLGDELEVLEQTPDYRISTWRCVMFLAWRGPETVAGIIRSRSLMEPWAARKKGGVVLVVLMPTTKHPPPDEEARKAMANVSRDASALFKGIGIIGNDRGFIGSVVRSVMTARQLLVRSPVPFKMFSSAAEAAPWIAQRVELNESLEPEFSAIVENARWS